MESKLQALPDDKLMHLYQAAKQAVFARMQPQGQDPSAGAPPAAPPMSPSPGPSPSPAPGAPPAFKAEKPMAANPANGGGKTSAVKIGKSEQEEDMDTKKVADLEQQVELLGKALTLLAGAPLRKAVTSVSHLPKPGDTAADKKDVAKLTKAEVTAKLIEKTRDPAMSKADRKLVNGFYDNSVSLEKIAHLLQ